MLLTQRSRVLISSLPIFQMIFPAYCSEKPLKLKTRHSNKKSLSIPCPLQYNEPPTQPRRLTYKSSSVHRIDSPRWQHSFLKNWIRNEMKFLIESISSKQKDAKRQKKIFLAVPIDEQVCYSTESSPPGTKKNRNWFRFFCFSVSAEKSREIYPPGILGHKSKLITAVKKSFPVKPKFPDPSSLFIRSFSRVALQSMQRTFSPKVKHP